MAPSSRFNNDSGDDHNSVSSKSMKKWGIPRSNQVSNEMTLLERLVWVQYTPKGQSQDQQSTGRSYWWPALLYQNYSELQTQLYNQLDLSMKAQFAMAIMKEVQQPKNKHHPIKVARLLGRTDLEVVEVKDGQYAEFYWQLPNVLPQACHRKLYGNNVELYLEFHRALDQVEQIVQDVSSHGANPAGLMPSKDAKTWEQRARDALEGELSTSAPKANGNTTATKRDQMSKNEDGMMDNAGLFQGFDNFMATLTKGVGDIMGRGGGKSQSTTSKETKTLKSQEKNASHGDARQTKEPLRPPPMATPTRRFASGNGAESFHAIAPIASASCHQYDDEEDDQFRPSFSYMRQNNSSDRFSSTRAVLDEARDPSNEYHSRRRNMIGTPNTANTNKNQRKGASNSKESGSKNGSGKRTTPTVELLPGLEADDVFPGITETNVWKNVMEHMMMAKKSTNCGNGQDGMEEASVALNTHNPNPSLKQQRQPRRASRASDHNDAPTERRRHHENYDESPAAFQGMSTLPSAPSNDGNRLSYQSTYRRLSGRPSESSRYNDHSYKLTSDPPKQPRTLSYENQQQQHQQYHRYSGQQEPYESRGEEQQKKDTTEDDIVAEPRSKAFIESDDTLWGFLTCRATDAI